MRTLPDRLETIDNIFPAFEGVLSKLDAAKIHYQVGGSVALYLQGNARKPHDIDIMFTSAAHSEANQLFGIKTIIVARPNVSMQKSTPFDNGNIDFLSNYTVIFNGKNYTSPPKETVALKTKNKEIDLVPAEKIVVFKLIGQRQHHSDLEDVDYLIKRPDFNSRLFYEIVNVLGAQKIVKQLLVERGLDMYLHKIFIK